MPDPSDRDPRQPDWPLPDLRRAAEAHWDDAARLRLLERDLAHRSESGAGELRARVAARLRELQPGGAERPRVIRREPVLPRVQPPPLPTTPTPEMAAVLRQLALERASGDSARQEAAALRRELAEQRARLAQAEAARTHRHEVEAARAEARAARAEAARLAERLAFVSASSARRGPDPSARPARDPVRRPNPEPAPDPAYAELGLSPDLSDDLLPVLERALLRHHHPDRAPPEGREAATRRFQAITRAFERIRRLRGLPG